VLERVQELHDAQAEAGLVIPGFPLQLLLQRLFAIGQFTLQQVFLRQRLGARPARR